MKKLNLLDVKQALKDARFRTSLPIEFTEDVQKYLQNPACACNIDIYRKLMKKAIPQLKAYFPDREIPDLEREESQNHWTVISCHKDELQAKLKALPLGRKQLAIARYEDQVTVVINELGIL